MAVILASIKVLIVIGLLLILGIGVQSTAGLRFVAAGFIFLALILLTWSIPRWGAIFTLLFLVLLGGIRRWLIFDFGWPAYDPLILISPLITLVCFLQLVISRKVPADTPVSKSIKYLLLIMLLQVFNPLQGGIMVGLGGVIYYIAPLLWFYVGRTYGNSQIALTVYKVTVVAFILAAIYGQKQVFFGISSSESEWLKTVGVGSMVSDNALRVFSTFASQQEYAIATSCAITICVAFIFQRKFQYIFPLFLLIPALLYTGTRGPVVCGSCAVCVQWALMGRKRAAWIPRLGLALILGVYGLVWSLSSINTANLDVGQADLLRHQQEGLLNPENSTAGSHAFLVGNGIVSGFMHPLGSGLGSTTIAAGKLGGSGDGAETDHGNLFISLGFIGGVCYLILNFLIFKQALTLWNRSRNVLFLILIGFLTATFSQWLNGGLYCICFLNWFGIGILDRVYLLEMKAPVINNTNSIQKASLGQRGNLGFQKRTSRSRIAIRKVNH